jgi:hypothetical protein
MRRTITYVQPLGAYVAGYISSSLSDSKSSTPSCDYLASPPSVTIYAGAGNLYQRQLT